MSRLRWVGVALAVVAGALSVANAVMLAIYVDPSQTGLLNQVLFRASPVPFALVAGVVVANRPRHPVAWLLVAGAVTSTGEAFAKAYMSFALVHPHAPLRLFFAWVENSTWAIPQAVLLVTLMLFPSGRPLGPRWRAGVVAAGVFAVWELVVCTLIPGPFEDYAAIVNPLGVPSLGRDTVIHLVQVALVLLPVCLVAGVTSLVLRFRRARGDERQQLKWLAVGAAALVLLWAASGLLGQRWGWLSNFGVTLCIGSIGVALLRYRLYDIDRVVSRTVSWALVTALLVGVYAAVVTGVGAALPRGSSSYAVAIATLAAVALLQPVRRRLQVIVDRRFDRAHYDASRTVAAFATSLRDDLDLESVRDGLLGTVQQTVAPAAASVALIGGAAR